MVSSYRIIFAHISRHNLDEISVWVSRAPCYHLWGLLPSKNVSAKKKQTKKTTHINFQILTLRPAAEDLEILWPASIYLGWQWKAISQDCNQRPIFFPWEMDLTPRPAFIFTPLYLYMTERLAAASCLLRCVLDIVTGCWVSAGLDVSHIESTWLMASERKQITWAYSVLLLHSLCSLEP